MEEQLELNLNSKPRTMADAEFYRVAFKQKLTLLFKALRKEKITALQNFKCCGSCASSEIFCRFDNGEFKTEGFCYYHKQDDARINGAKNQGTYLRFGSFDGDEEKCNKIAQLVSQKAKEQGYSVS